MLVLAIVLGALIGYFVWEYQAHSHNLRRVPLRVHVNGTRGKSSVTRLIAAGLRAGGIRTCAKTTGSAPRMILENGTEYTIQRQGRANIVEQVRAVAVTARRGGQALVAECMALNPAYQVLCEEMMLKSQIGVITNARADHLDVMGPTVYDVAAALSGIAPHKGVLCTAENDPDLLAIMAAACLKSGSRLVASTPDGEGVTEDMMRGFGYIEHPDNVALALRVCREAGVAPEAAIRGMWAAEPDIGVLRIIHLAFFAKEIDFINALAANDPDSTLFIWKRTLSLFSGERTRVAMLHCRADRPHRSIQLGKILPAMEHMDRVLLTGTGTRLALEAALQAGLHPERIVDVDSRGPAEVFEKAVAQIARSGVVFGLGNIGGGGGAIVEYFQNRSVQPQEPVAGA